MLWICALAACSWLLLSSLSWAGVNVSWVEAGAIIEVPRLRLQPDACPCEFALLLLWCKPGYIHEHTLRYKRNQRMFAHKLTVFEQGVGGNWPYDPTFLLSMNHKMLKTRWVSLLKLTLWNANYYNRYPWFSESWIHIYWGLMFLPFFSGSKGEREFERQVQHISCKGIKLKIRLTKYNPTILISHSLKQCSVANKAKSCGFFSFLFSHLTIHNCRP